MSDCNLTVLSSTDVMQWKSALSSTPLHDFYHTWAYHRLAESKGDGHARLLVFRSPSSTVALPVVLRPLAALQGTGTVSGSARWFDATSVYGYAGPALSSAECSTADQKLFREHVLTWLADQQVVTLFARLHPLFDQRAWLAGMGDCSDHGQTVALDLTVPEAEQVARYRKGHRYEINRARQAGIICVLDEEGTWRRQFAAIYRATMARVDARADYYFEDAYFDTLLDDPSLGMRLFVALAGGVPVAGALFAHTGAIVQYHLAGTLQSHTALAPMKLVIDTARQWATAQGARWLHLGGGVGSGQDSLFAFKLGFGGSVHPFRLWRWVVNPAAEAELTSARAAWAAAHGGVLDTAFFPRYRSFVSTVPLPDAGPEAAE